MIAFELDSSKEGIEIFLDENGVEELINYLSYIKKNNDHYHLLVDNELDNKLNHGINTLIKHVKLIYLDNEWFWK